MEFCSKLKRSDFDDADLFSAELANFTTGLIRGLKAVADRDEPVGDIDMNLYQFVKSLDFNNIEVSFGIGTDGFTYVKLV